MNYVNRAYAVGANWQSLSSIDMSGRTIKAAVAELLIQEMGIEGHKIFTRYPRTLSNDMGTAVVLWIRRGQERRFAGSGRSAGPIHGVKTVPWTLAVHVNQWGHNIETDYDTFETFIDKMLQVFRMSSVLPGAVDPDNGSQVLSFGENMDIENLEPGHTAQFIHFQAFINVGVEEIYNA